MVGRAAVSLRGDWVYVQSYSRDPDGPFMVNGWFRSLSRDAEAAQLGRCVLEALRHTEDRVKGLGQARAEHLAAFLRQVGVRSYAGFLRGTRGVGVVIAGPGEPISLVPYRNGGATGPDRGFHALEELRTAIPADSPHEEIGRAVAAALHLAT